MKRIFALAALCGLALPSMAFAQSGPPAMPAGHPDMAAMRQTFEQAEKIHKAERAQILAALSPAHRALVASIVGNLAIAPNPDPKAAAARLDAALSPSEKSAVLAAHNSAMTQMRNVMHSMMAQREGAHGAQGMQSGKRHQWSERHHHTPTAGEVVLMIAGGHGEHGMPFAPRGGPGMMMRDRNGPGMQGPPPGPPGAPAPANT